MADPLTIGLGLGMGVFSAITGASSQNSARAAEQKRINAQYKRDNQLYRYNWRTTQREFNYRTRETDIARQNQNANIDYLEQTAQRDYQYNLAIRDFDYANQVRQYNESERIYGLQRQFNAQAEAEAQSNEERRYQEILTGMAFDQQDMVVKLLQEEGAVAAKGVSGRSAAKELGSVLASYGRNQAIVAESLLSANKETMANRRQISLERKGADLSAEARRMLAPLKAPAPMAPLKMPRATILDPLKPKKPPKPIKGTNTVPGASGLAIANNFITSGLEAYKMFGGSFT
jgi:hypothetical protein